MRRVLWQGGPLDNSLDDGKGSYYCQIKNPMTAVSGLADYIALFGSAGRVMKLAILLLQGTFDQKQRNRYDMEVSYELLAPMFISNDSRCHIPYSHEVLVYLKGTTTPKSTLPKPHRSESRTAS